MFLANIVTLALIPAATSLAFPREYVPPNTCCFTLQDSSTGQVVRQQSSSGLLYLGGSQPTGWYCINLSDANDILLDRSNYACFVNPDKAFQCLDPTPGNDLWAIEQSGGNVLVEVNGDSVFKLCPTSSGNVIYTSAKKGGNCRALRLKAQSLTGTCGNLRA
jgi:outer membrane protein assembly factor BamB